MRSFSSIVAVSLMAISLAVPAMAQSETGAGYVTADHQMRSSKMIGMAVYNDHGEKIGVIDEILLPMAGGEPNTVLSVGGFLGGGKKLVEVPLSHVHFTGAKPMMADGDKATLMAMPRYSYTTLANPG
ncbi:MAG: PRC-barrel domain-containing protein [Acetobacteraceae bacterium]